MICNLERLGKLKSSGHFELQDPRLYTQRQQVKETQQQLKTLSALLILLLLAVMLIFSQAPLPIASNPNFIWFLALALYIHVCAGLTFEIRILQVLGMTLLAVVATTHLHIVDQLGGVSLLLLVNIVLLFTTIPLVPQGFRQLATLAVAIYLLLTLSAIQADQAIDDGTLLRINELLLAACLADLALVFRSIRSRKQLAPQSTTAIARGDLFNLYHRDRLTSAWNRGYLNTALKRLHSNYQLVTHFYHFIVIDLDNFKELNDTYSREFGDQVLKKFSETLIKAVGSSGYLVRIGGDEFILLLVHDAPDSLMTTLELSIRLHVKQEKPEAEFGMVWGSVIQPLRTSNDPEQVYREAEKALNILKRASKKADIDGLAEKEVVARKLECIFD